VENRALGFALNDKLDGTSYVAVQFDRHLVFGDELDGLVELDFALVE